MSARAVTAAEKQDHDGQQYDRHRRQSQDLYPARHPRGLGHVISTTLGHGVFFLPQVRPDFINTLRIEQDATNRNGYALYCGRAEAMERHNRGAPSGGAGSDPACLRRACG